MALEPMAVPRSLRRGPHGPVVGPERLIRALEYLSLRASQARDGPDLATKSGATKPGPGKARPESMSPRTLCAIMIWEAWKHVHKGEPAPKNRQAAEAAEAYWRAAGGEGHHVGEEPLAVWRHHFRKAAAPRGEGFRAEWRRHPLRLSDIGLDGTLPPNRRDQGKRLPPFMADFSPCHASETSPMLSQSC